MLKKVLYSILILILGVVIGYGLLMAVFAIDVPNEIYENAKTVLDQEGYHPRESIRTGKTDYFHEVVPDILDFGTDQLIIEHSLTNPTQPVYIHALIDYYSRYWHGYIAVWRPVFLLFDISEVRILNLGLQLFLAVWLAYLILKISQKKIYVFAWLTIYFFMSPNSLACNFQYSSIYYVMVVSAIALLQFKKFFSKNDRYLYLFLISGMCTSYFDFLTYPMLSWAIPAALFISFYDVDEESTDSSKRMRTYFIRLVFTALFWIAGYFIFWTEKWVLAQIVLYPRRVFQEVLNETTLRVGIVDSMTLLQRLKAFWVNWKHLTYRPFEVVLFGWAAYWLYRLVRFGLKSDEKIAAYAIMLFSAPVWYIIGAEHTIGHHLYTWRVSLGTLFAALMFFCACSEMVTEKSKCIKRVVVLLGIMCVCACVGVALYSVIPIEKKSFWNYDIAPEERMLPAHEQNAYSMDFTPQYSRVTEIAPLFECDSQTGYYEIILSDTGNVLYRVIVNADEFNVNRVNSIPVDWHLKKGKTYSLVLSTENLDKESKVWVVTQNDRYEFVGNEESLQIGYTYHTPFDDKSDALFYILTWFSLFMICVQVIYSIISFAQNKRKIAEGIDL